LGKVSSREENYYVRLNQSGFRNPLRLGVIISVGVPFSANVISRLKSKVSPHPHWPLLIFQDTTPGAFAATDVVAGDSASQALLDRIISVWPAVRVHDREDVWGGANLHSSIPSLSAMDPAPLIELLQHRKNVVLEGVPGTGKSFAVRAITAAWQSVTGRELAEPRVVVLHPSSSYEDLVEGLRPGQVSAGPVEFTNYPAHAADTDFRPHLGRFGELCRDAAGRPDVDFLLVLDELNRANVPKAMGELMLLLDRTKRAKWDGEAWVAPADGTAMLTYTGVRFWVPENVHVLGTMNTTDRSVAPLDAALRRRFDFLRLEPMAAATLQSELAPDGEADPFLLEVLDVWHELNEHVLRPMIGPDAVLGHSYLFELHDQLEQAPANRELLTRAFLLHTLIPQLVESVAASGREEDIFGGEPTDRPTAIQDLDGLLNEFGLSLQLQGNGLGRRVTAVPLDVETPPSLEA
jgi:MoxR-like ATPase